MSDPRTGERVEIIKGHDKQWYFRRVAANNETVSFSEGYHRFGDCEDTARELFDEDVYVEHDDGSWSLWEKERSPAA